ncbi:unnamed protein product [Linum trigynum]|uniref:Uncharacterized protein n=1 Tax=Linum trigynum TaxID=586398 RepID=A0AAV2E6Z1_9ROSI
MTTANGDEVRSSVANGGTKPFKILVDYNPREDLAYKVYRHSTSRDLQSPSRSIRSSSPTSGRAACTGGSGASWRARSSPSPVSSPRTWPITKVGHVHRLRFPLLGRHQGAPRSGRR